MAPGCTVVELIVAISFSTICFTVFGVGAVGFGAVMTMSFLSLISGVVVFGCVIVIVFSSLFGGVVVFVSDSVFVSRLSSLFLFFVITVASYILPAIPAAVNPIVESPAICNHLVDCMHFSSCAIFSCFSFTSCM